MHRPPAVLWDLGPSRWKRRALGGLILLAALVWLGFLRMQGWGVSSAVLLATLLAGTLTAAIGRSGSPGGQLSWDGEQWHWLTDRDLPLQTMVCMLDLQVMMLLRVGVEGGKSHWFWLDSSDMSASWKAVRRAIVASTYNARQGASQEASRVPNGDPHDG